MGEVHEENGVLISMPMRAMKPLALVEESE
jgi:hypothetical protein